MIGAPAEQPPRQPINASVTQRVDQSTRQVDTVKREANSTAECPPSVPLPLFFCPPIDTDTTRGGVTKKKGLVNMIDLDHLEPIALITVVIKTRDDTAAAGRLEIDRRITTRSSVGEGACSTRWGWTGEGVWWVALIIDVSIAVITQ